MKNFNSSKIKLTKTPISRNCQLPNGYFYYLQVIYNSSAFGSTCFCVSFSTERKFERIERKFKTQNPNHRQAEVQQLMQPETGCVSSNCRIGGGNGTNSDLVKHKYTVSHSRLWSDIKGRLRNRVILAVELVSETKSFIWRVYCI